MSSFSTSGLGVYGTLASYASFELTDASPAQSFVEPLTLAQVKKFLNLPDRADPDVEEDDELLAMISGARVIAEYMQGRDLVRKQWDMSMDYFRYPIELRPNTVSVELVRFRGSDGTYTTLAESTDGATGDYIVDLAKQPGLILPRYNTLWPLGVLWPSSAVLVRFTSGIAAGSTFWSGDIGTHIKIGMQHLITSWFENKIPFEPRAPQIGEYPFTVTHCMSFGSMNRVR